MVQDTPFKYKAKIELKQTNFSNIVMWIKLYMQYKNKIRDDCKLISD